MPEIPFQWIFFTKIHLIIPLRDFFAPNMEPSLCLEYTVNSQIFKIKMDDTLNEGET